MKSLEAAGVYTYADYDEKPDPSHRPMYLAPVLEALREIPPGSRVLDAGCGGGDFAIGLHEAGYEVLGSDASASAIRAARALGVGRFEQASLYDDLLAPFGHPDISAIVCVEVIEHLYSPLTFVRRAHEALPDGGLLIVTTPYWGWLKNVALAVTNRMDRSLTALWEGGHIKHFSRRTLTQLLEENGFEPVAFRGAGETARQRRIPYLWSGMMMAFRKLPTDSRNSTGKSGPAR
ncbi:class I SAM-dependent methyltransferase [Qipengyuania sp. XHP0207]|uniref:class I SAM-dependent methyltransferase n=1 Tax=Qipengyuania sp. XHP0207 TaxID=3038078 RepID=UPI00241EC2B6|nr:class I SAM-dependent methyltransferase [Qipengyuania sp. XHP0207]MDG5749444.1 class I SAM-dependent methyltransferase [Qipengyuania sp. XHP0207]